MTERPRRRRLLTEAESEIWVAVAQTVKARPDAFLPKLKPTPSAPPPPPASLGTPAPLGPLPGLTASPRPKKPQLPPLAPFEKRYRRQVTRGQVEIEAAIDLHGMNQAQAHHALHVFLRDAHHRGTRLVLVVTGKGRPRMAGGGADWNEPGVLRRAVPSWLREEAMRGIVLGFEEAGQPHGGMGALYIRLRRRAS